MADNPSKVAFINFTLLKLWLKNSCKTSGASEHNNTRCVGIEPVSGSRFLWSVNLLKNRLQCISIVTAAWVHRQRSRLVDHNQRSIFVKNLNVDTHVGFDLERFTGAVALARMHLLCCQHGLKVGIQNLTVCKTLQPIRLRQVRKNVG